MRLVNIACFKEEKLSCKYIDLTIEGYFNFFLHTPSMNDPNITAFIQYVYKFLLRACIFRLYRRRAVRTPCYDSLLNDRNRIFRIEVMFIFKEFDTNKCF